MMATRKRFTLFRGRGKRVLGYRMENTTASKSLMPISLSVLKYELPRPAFISPHRRAAGLACHELEPVADSRKLL
jgi:hypothetical protein